MSQIGALSELARQAVPGGCALAAIGPISTDTISRVATVARDFAGILTGLIAVLAVPLALRQIANLQRELRRFEAERRMRLDGETSLDITARYSLTRTARPAGDQSSARSSAPRPRAAPQESAGDAMTGEAEFAQPSPAPQPGKRVLRMDLTLANVGRVSVDLLACLVAARELERQGDDVIDSGRDVQWQDLTRHYWDDDATGLSPGLSTHKNTVYAQDALSRIKAQSRKTLSRIDQVRADAMGPELYLLYRVFVVARASTRNADQLRAWAELQRALLNINAPAFRVVTGEHDPLGYVASPDGWRLFLYHYSALADPKLPHLRAAADREELNASSAEERRRVSARVALELQDYCRKTLLPAWRRFRADYEQMVAAPAGVAALLDRREFRRQQREVEQLFPWASQEIWTEYFYVTLDAEE